MFYIRVTNFYKLINAAGIQVKSAPAFSIKAPIETTVSLDLVHSHVQDEQNEIFLDEWMTNEVSTWHTRGELPRSALRPLLDLIDLYFKDKSISDPSYKFSDELLDWARSLSEGMIYSKDSKEDIACLYGQIVQTHQGSSYLIKILIDCLNDNEPDLDEKVRLIARWLCSYDASFIVNSLALHETYASLTVGPAFNLDCMRTHLKRLPATCPRVKEGIKILLSLSQAKVKMDAATMQGLGEIYRLRWLHLLEDSASNYLGCQQGDNAPWIHLAQLVCGAGWLNYLFDPLMHKGNSQHFKENYYRFLMPTIKCDTDPIQLNGIANHALTHLILSHSGRYLILLDNPVSQFIANRKFINWNTRQPKPFTDLELVRMSFSRFKAYISKAKEASQAEDLPIAMSTLQAIKQLVNGSFYNKGLHDDYDEFQMVSAGMAYHHFYGFLKQLPLDERGRFLNQRIRLGKQNMTVDDILLNVENDGCIAGSGELFTKLLLDYNPYEHLSSELEVRAAHNQGRQNSELKVYADFNGLDASEAKRRILILAASIMSHSFEYSLTAETMSLWDCSNQLFGPIKSIFKLIKPMIKTDNFKNVRHVYAMIIESFAKPALLHPDSSWFDWFGSPSVSQRWLQSLVDESLFKGPYRWFKPEFLLATLLPKVQLRSPMRAELEVFLDELVYTCIQNQSLLLKEVRVNILFAKLLNSPEPSIRQHMLGYLQPAIPRLEENKDDYKRIFLNYLRYRLTLLVNTTGYWSALFFNQPYFYDKEKLTRLITSLQVNMSSLNVEAIRIIKNKIEEMGKSVNGLDAITNMVDYLQQMVKMIESPQSDRVIIKQSLLCSVITSV